jgi:hypothetical protein
MSTISQIRDAFKTTLEANISGLITYDTVYDVVQVPCAVVMPEDVNYVIGMGNCYCIDFGLYLMVPRTEVREAQDKLDAYLSRSGASSIPVVLKANRTLGLSDVDVTLRKASGYGSEWEVAKVPHVGAKLHVEVLVTQ